MVKLVTLPPVTTALTTAPLPDVIVILVVLVKISVVSTIILDQSIQMVVLHIQFHEDQL